MEDKKFSLSEAENAAAFSAATLRELQQRAEQALAAGREQATRLEADITRQLDELAQTISSQLSADSDGASQSDSLQAEVDRLSKELQRSHEKCESLRGELEASHKELATVSGTHGEILAERDQLLNRLAEFESQLQSVQAEWQGELEKAQKEWEEEESSLRAERDGVANQLADRASLEHDRDELSKKVAELEAGKQVTQGEWRTKLEHSQAEWQGERSKLFAERDTLVKQLADAAKVERDRDGLIKKVSDLEAGQQSAAGEWRANLERSQAEWQAERSSLCAERDTLTKQLADAAKLEIERDELIKKVADLAKGKDATQGEWRSKLEHSQAEWQAERGQLCAERDTLTKQLADAAKVELDRDELIKKVAELEAGQHSAKGEWRSKLEHTQAEWEAERKSLCAERDQLVDQLSDHASLALERDELIKKVAELQAGQQTAQLESRTKSEQSRSEWHAERSKLRTECDELTRKLADHAALELERDELNQKLGALETQQQAAQDEWRQQLLGFETRLREQQQSWNEQRVELSAARTSLERERDAVQQKFDLALQDVQRFRSRVAELEQDLARRPETKQADSAELVALRAERDALTKRVGELEQQPVSQVDPNVEQQRADLQRRFELAVEDVRELKTKNAALETKLAAASKQPAAQADAGGMDWESQKRRLLASLEGGDGKDEPVPKQDRITIEGTIEMTDAVVSEKDRQIAELQAKLLAGNDDASCATIQDAKLQELLDTDEIIAQHRKRVQELESEMEAKLRAAELELSVERAKMGRQRVELEELKADLDAKMQNLPSEDSAPATGQPKRRWRSKLGLGGEE